MKRWPRLNPCFWETAPFFRPLCLLVAGIATYYYCDGVPALVTLICITVFFLGYSIFIAFYHRQLRQLPFILFCFLFFGLGYALSQLCDIKNDTHWYGRHLAAGTTYMARLNADPKEGDNSWRLKVDILKVIDKKAVYPVDGPAIVYVYKHNAPMLFHAGDTLLLPGDWQPVQNSGNPFGFDLARYCQLNNIYHQQFCSINSVRLYALSDNNRLPFTVKLHNYCMAALNKYIPGVNAKGLIEAMLLGDEVNLDAGLRQSFSDTGIVHIIAISGGNVIMFFLLISWLLAWIRHKKYHWLKYILALPLVWIYVIMAGSSPSAVRAAVMFSLLAGGFIFGKNNNSLNQLLATAFVLLCAQPAWLFAPGFQLSFLAVLSLIIFYRPLHHLYVPPKDRGIAGYILQVLWETVSSSLAAEILIAPLAAYYFHSFPAWFLVANVLALLFMFAVLVSGIAIIVLSAMPPVELFIGKSVSALVDIFYSIIRALQSAEPSFLHTLQLDTSLFIMLYLVIALLVVFIFYRRTRMLIAAMTVITCFLVLSCFNKYSTLRQRRLVVYNAAKCNHIELIEGNNCLTLRTDTAAQKQIQFATKEAHIHWQVQARSTGRALRSFNVNNKHVLILDSPEDDTLLPVDILVINYKSRPNLRDMLQKHHPSVIVIGNNYSRREQLQWAAAAKDIGVQLHATSLNGAFVVY